MSNYDASRIRKPRHFKINGLDSKNSKPRYVIGFDSEADTSSGGRPMLFQFSLPGTVEESTITVEIPDSPNAGLRAFLDFLDEHCADNGYAYLVYVWNLAYELTQIFHDLPPEVRSEEHVFITTTSDEWKIELLNVKRQMVRFARGKTLVTVLDGMAFYQTSLDRAAKMLGLGEKYTLGERLSRTMFTRENLKDADFLRYARRDAFITRRIGEFISLQHDNWKIPTTMSAPHLASTVFKTMFLESELTLPGPDLEQAGLYSYHGGKNGFYLDGPQEFPDIWQYDITSAYPEAMRQLPDMDRSGWKSVYRHRRGAHALYCVRGAYTRCRYRGMQSHDGSWNVNASGADGIWITSYELDAMLDHGEFDIDDLYGFEMIGPSGGALQSYVDHFFSIKQRSSGPERETAKLMLNSLYGKFFQKQPLGIVGMYDLDTREWNVTDPEQDYDWEAGGLYHPPIASLITGFVRARIHRLEHKYESVMTSTDGFFGFTPPDPDEIGKGLGQLTAQRGRLRIWRERLYIFDGIDGARKYALHGFRGSVAELEDIIPLRKGTYRYMGRQMITLKMSTINHNGRGYEPGTFAELPYAINI